MLFRSVLAGAGQIDSVQPVDSGSSQRNPNVEAPLVWFRKLGLRRGPRYGILDSRTFLVIDPQQSPVVLLHFDGQDQ